MTAQYKDFGAALTKAGVPTSGVYQVETAVVVGTITLTGDATFTVTSALVTGSPVAVTVPVEDLDTATQVAAKAAVAINANAAIAAHFLATSNSANLVLTALESAANDGTLNIAYTNGTCTGLTPDATSNNTTSGVKGDYKGVVAGNVCVDTTNFDLYENTGDRTRPVWTVI